MRKRPSDSGSSGTWPVVALMLVAAGLASQAVGQATGQAATGAPTAPAPATAGPGVTILDGSGVWRVLHSWKNPPGHVENGFVDMKISESTLDFLTVYPPKDWTQIGFDDSRWARQRYPDKFINGELDGRAGSGSPSPYLRQLSLRGKFTVSDPGKVKPLWLDMAYRGGVAVYVNGKEVGRQHLGANKELVDGLPAEIYPRKAYLKDDGKPWSWFTDADAIAKEGIYQLRARRVEKLAIPSELLVQGVNVLAVDIRAAVYPSEFFAKGVPWASCGLIELHLRSESADGLVPNVVRPAGLQVWNCNLLEEVTPDSWADPHEKLGPIRLAGSRNGSFTGKVVVSSDALIRGLRAAVSDLAAAAGGAKIPASAARVGYGRFWSAAGSPLRDDGIVETPLDEAPILKGRAGDPKARAAEGLPPVAPGAIQSVYVTISIPKDAAAGDYRGTLSIAGADKPIQVPIELKVIDWALPDPADFAYWYGLIQSPEGVGLYHQVPLWSDRHFELIGKGFDLIAQTGGKVLFINLIAQTEYGNEHSMALWVRPEGPAGPVDWARCTHDLSRVQKYVDTAVKRLGQGIRFVVLGVWQPCEGKKSPRVSVLDPKTGALEVVEGPPHGSPESAAFWKPVLTGVRDILLKAGFKDDAILLGYASDGVPDKRTAGVFWQILPKAGWQAARHAPSGVDHIECAGGESVSVRYTSNVWGSEENYDPKTRRAYGWNHNYAVRRGLRTWLDRTTYDSASLARFRSVCEQQLMADRPGLGQIGADFWPAPPDKPGGYRLGTLYSRYPHSSNVGSGNRGCTTNQLLYPDAGGAARSVRFEAVRENIQECEARIYLEKLLILEQMCPLSAELKAKAQGILDQRTRWHRINYNFHGWPDAGISWPYSGWEGRTAQLYEVCAEVAKAPRTEP